MKAYVGRNLQTGETIIVTGRLHWVIYAAPFSLAMAACLSLLPWLLVPVYGWLFLALSAGLGVAASVSLVRNWFTRWITELTVTNRRVVYGTSFVFRRTVEMNMDKVESVRVDQSIVGRILGYGTIHVLGTGQGIEHLHMMASPLAIRNAIIAR